MSPLSSIMERNGTSHLVFQQLKERGKRAFLKTSTAVALCGNDDLLLPNGLLGSLPWKLHHITLQKETRGLLSSHVRL